MGRIAAPLLAVALSTLSCSTPSTPGAGGDIPGPTPAIQRVSLGAMPDIDVDKLLAHAKALASDAFEGRGPGTRGEDLTVEYLVAQFKQAGLRPGNPDGTYIQRVPLVGITPVPASLRLEKDGVSTELRWKSDVVAWTKHVAESASIDGSEMVFVGYGVTAPEFDWDDYKGVDVRGKTLVMLVNDPPVPDPADASALDPNVFGGRAMTYYGRWTYKYEIGAERGAAAVLLIHETGPAGYPFDVVQAKTAEQFELVSPDKNMRRPAIEGWITTDQGRQLMTLAGKDFETLKAAAASRDFAPVPLGVRASMTIRNKLRTLTSRNVAAVLDGGDPRLKAEAVVYTAHWDHLGVGAAMDGDRIYNGAVDNAIGTAGLLELARAFTQLPAPPKRSVLFLSVTAEEQGLLGSQHYAEAPLFPLARTAAVINIDTLNVHGRTRDITLVGYGASDLDDYVRDAAGEQGRLVRPDPDPDKGGYYRSDHFTFAKRGVPALDPSPGVEFVGRPDGYGRGLIDAYTERDYHRPTDAVRADWDLSGAAEDLKVFFAVGYRVAEADRLPEWKSGQEFKATRDAMLKALTRK